jgi:two-component system, OmpR family, sensor histidine kinase BaeS
MPDKVLIVEDDKKTASLIKLYFPFIFGRFYRGEKSRSREHGGAGIGLAIVKELIEAHDGHVGAETSDKETRIWFSIPV